MDNQNFDGSHALHNFQVDQKKKNFENNKSIIGL